MNMDLLSVWFGNKFQNYYINRESRTLSKEVSCFLFYLRPVTCWENKNSTYIKSRNADAANQHPQNFYEGGQK